MSASQDCRATRQWLQKQFRTSGLQLDAAALGHLVENIQDLDDPEDFVHQLMDEASSRTYAFFCIVLSMGLCG